MLTKFNFVITLLTCALLGLFSSSIVARHQYYPTTYFIIKNNTSDSIKYYNNGHQCMHNPDMNGILAPHSKSKPHAMQPDFSLSLRKGFCELLTHQPSGWSKTPIHIWRDGKKGKKICELNVKIHFKWTVDFTYGKDKCSIDGPIRVKRDGLQYTINVNTTK